MWQNIMGVHPFTRYRSCICFVTRIMSGLLLLTKQTINFRFETDREVGQLNSEPITQIWRLLSKDSRPLRVRKTATHNEWCSLSPGFYLHSDVYS